ncbi:MAG: redoxin domain-containing protein [Betaproteobacteria bacterium]|nr:redoxin domain-containing protein [Betaproteobacteria bacterium]
MSAGGPAYRDAALYPSGAAHHDKENSMAAIGSKIPDFKLKANDASDVSLGQYAGKWVVISAYPLAFTGG